MYVYRKESEKLFVVGYFKPTGEWEAETEWRFLEEATDRVNYLNGGNAGLIKELIRELRRENPIKEAPQHWSGRVAQRASERSETTDSKEADT